MWIIRITLCFFVFWTTINLSAQENYTLLNRAAEIFQKEKREIKNYRVRQEVISKIKELSGMVIEKRIQAGYFQSPEEFIFVCKEIEVNGIKQILTKPLIERSSKTEIDWLTREGMASHSFQTLSTDSKIVKYLVSPSKIQSGYFRGQLWLSPQTARIVKILKEPIIKKREMMKYSLELSFEKEFTYQMPTQTLLTAVYQVNNRITEVQIEANFADYKFNQDLSQELPK